MKDQYIVKPIAKALQLLEYVVEEGRELALTEIAHRSGLPKTTAFRYLQTFCQAGFLSYDPHSDRYRMGVKLWTLAQTKGSQSVLRDAAIPTMRELRDRFNETINLAELDGNEVVYIEMVESRRSLRTLAKIGKRDPAFCTAVGKSMLAFMPKKGRQLHLPTELQTRTDPRNISFEEFEEEMEATVIRGFALDRGENEEDSFCIGAPIFHSNGGIIAGLSLSAPSTRINAPLQQQIGVALLEASREIGVRIVCVGEER